MFSTPGRSRLARAAGLAAAAVVALTACGGGSASETSDSAGELAAEQVLTVAPSTFPVAIDPHSTPAEAAVIGPVKHVMQTLVERSDDGFAPLLAQSWENPDDLTWVFHLDPAAVFSDGTPVTATDVAASGARLKEKSASLWAPVNAFEATDATTLTIRTDEVVGTLLGNLTMLLVGQADRLEDEAYWQAPVGSGPFTVEEFKTDDRLVLARNENYWRDKPVLEKITFKSIPEESARITALANGEIDFIAGVTGDAVAELTSLDNVVYDDINGWGYQFIWFNSGKDLLSDARVRRAMWHALDLQKIVGDLFGDRASVALAPLPQTAFGAPAFQPYEYNPEKAKALLAESGYPDGISTTMMWADTVELRSFAQALISDWAKAGITVEGQPKERAVWLEDLRGKEWDLNLQGNTVATGDADYTLGRLYTCVADRMGYCNPALDQILADARSSLDQEERKRLYEEAAGIIWNEAVGIFPLDNKISVAYSGKLQGVELAPSGQHRYTGITISK